MKKRSFVLGTLALLMVGCSSTPETPDRPVTTVNSDESERQATTQEVVDAQSALHSMTLTPLSTAQNVTSVRPDGTLLMNNTPIMPMGFYHVSWAGNAAQRMRDMHAIADLGFNTMNATMFDPEGDLQGYGALLDAAQTRGMKLLVEDFNSTSIQAFKNHPALLGWMIADDCNNLITPGELQKRNDAVNALDGQHITYASMAISFANSHSDYFGRASAIGNQSYPIGTTDPIDVVYPMMKRLVAESATKGTLPIANLQSFKWENGRYPSTLELNSMTNQAIAAGVKGILYYTYLDRTNNLASYTGLKAELKRLASEVKLLSPVLLEGQRVSLNVTVNGEETAANLWTYGGRRYLQVVSLNDTGSQSVKVQLPTAARTLQPLFAQRPTGLKVSGTTVSGRMTKLSTHWYEVQ